MAIACLLMTWQIGCAASTTCVRPLRPPTPSNELVDLMVETCQAAPGGKCRPTRMTIEVCESDLEEGCRERDSLYRYLDESLRYRNYIERLRGDS